MITSRVAATSATIPPVHTVHRVGIGGPGFFPLSFGVPGSIRRVSLPATQGEQVIGARSNGPLALVSIAVSLVPSGAALRGPRTASTVGMVFGGLFLMSGLVNLHLLDTEMDMLAFGLSNVVVSVLVCLNLLFTGSHGRISGGLPPGSPYHHGGRHDETEVDERTPAEPATDRLTDRELAKAERVLGPYHATFEQVGTVGRPSAYRTAADRGNADRSI